MNKTIENMIADYDVGDLHTLISELQERVTEKEKEDLILVWRVIDGDLCYGNFTEVDYPKAVDCLKEIAIERWNEQKDDTRKGRRHVVDLELRIRAEFMPESDAKEYLNG